MHKATSDRDKEEYRKTGKCFECGKQGHLARVCPTKRNRQTSSNRSIEIDDYESDHGLSDVRFNPADLAMQAMRLSEEDRDVFMRRLQEMGAESGFVDA